MTRKHYDLYQLDDNNRWQRIYRELSRMSAIATLSVELSEPTQEGKWKAVRVETFIQEFDEDLTN